MSCPNRKPPGEVPGGYNRADYREFSAFSERVGGFIRQRQLVKSGYACFGCWLPTKWCKFENEGQRCITNNSGLIHFVTFFYYILHRKGYSKPIGELKTIVPGPQCSEQVAKSITQSGTIFNTECIALVQLVNSFDWAGWFSE